MLDYALTKQQILRAGYSQNYSTRSNLGIGGFDLAERAYANETWGNQLRLQEAGPIGTNMFLNTRLQLRRYKSDSSSQLEAQTIRVLDGVTRGGAQVAGGVDQHDFELSSDLNYVRGNHQMRTGIALEGRHYRTDSVSNYLGTYIFTNEGDFLIGRPRNYTRRIGDPLIVYSHLEGGAYVQDDHPVAAEPDVQSRSPLRGADARQRPDRFRAASGPDVGAGHERTHDDPHQLRHFLQLDEHQRL